MSDDTNEISRRPKSKQKDVAETPKAKPVRDPYRLIGTKFKGRYLLNEYAGGGGMGAVYRAEDSEDQKTVAIKILKPDIVARSPEYIELFEREVAAARRLDHPNIVKVLDSGREDELSFMVMEWLEGETLEDAIAREMFTLPQAVRIFEQICSALNYAHQNQVIHLDIKPSNVILAERSAERDIVKVIDFGLSRIISKESGTTVTKFRGTIQYCAPEQFGGKVSHLSDIYSLGATLYHLLTGLMPFGTSYINAKMHPNLELPVIPSVARQHGLSYHMDIVIRRALHKSPSVRQQSASELFEEVYNAVWRKNKFSPDADGKARRSAAVAEETSNNIVPSMSRTKPRHIDGVLDDDWLSSQAYSYLPKLPGINSAYAPLDSRIASAFIDFLIVVLISSPFAAFIALNFTHLPVWRVQVWVLAVVVTVMFCYQTISLVLAGRTWGMKLFSLVVIQNHYPYYPTVKQCVFRTVIYMLSLATFGLGLYLAIFDVESRTAHDWLSDTLVLKIKPQRDL